MVTAKKAPTKVAPVKRRTPKPKAEPAVTVKHTPKNQTTADKVIDLIKWVDNPFKLFTVILLSFLALDRKSTRLNSSH